MSTRFQRLMLNLIGVTALVISPFLNSTPALATVVSLSPSSTLTTNADGKTKTAIIAINSPAGTWCEMAVGSTFGDFDYAWFNSLPCTTFTVQNIPLVDQIYLRVFAGGDYQQFTLSTTQPSTPTPIPPTPTPVPTPIIKKAPTFIAPTAGQKIFGASTQVSWTNQSANNYTVIVGSASGKSDYGTYSTKNTSITINNLPQNNKKVYVKITAQFTNKNLAKAINFVSSKPVVVPVPVPTPTPVPTPVPTPLPPVPTGSSISAVWANEGGDKVVQEDLRASNGTQVTNSVWNGNSISVFGAKNEVVNFNVVLEAKDKQASNVSVSFETLTGPNGFAIKGKPATVADLYKWTDRNIELFYVRYLQINGLSAFMAGNYDEQQLPARLRSSNRLWANRPAANKHFPDIAVPIELHNNFTIATNKNQSIWADIYIPKNAPAGTYTGTVTIKENGVVTKNIPVQLTVRNFTLPDEPSSKTMLYVGYRDVNERYLGEAYPAGTEANVATIKNLRDKHYVLAHRHKISLIDGDPNESVWNQDAPRPDMIARLNGSLFTAAQGYDGPGVGVGNGVYAIGPYGSWGWKNEGQSGMWAHTNNWANWFAQNAPGTEYFLHLIDEPDASAYPQIEQWASWINANPGVGKTVPSMVTMWPMDAQKYTPSLDYVTAGMTLGETDKWQTAVNYYQNTPGKKFMMYNGGRPGQGSFMTDDDGVALREMAWGQYKKNVSRWFFWESAYYNNFQGGTGQTNVFKQAMTFGGAGTPDPIRGLTGWNYSNGDGVLFYPGTDKIYPAESYNIAGPIASLRLKHWRRGIQDVDYLTLAAKVNPAKTQEIVNRLVPKAMWEVGVENPVDPTYLNGPVSWSDDPNVWEAARLELANIIEGK